MATYTDNLKLTKIATGDEDGTWGSTTNNTYDLLDQSFAAVSHSMSDANETITISNGGASDARYMVLVVTGTLSANRTVTLAPNTLKKVWFVKNSTTGGFSLNIKQGTGSEVTIANGYTAMVYGDGAGSGAAVGNVLSKLDLDGAASASFYADDGSVSAPSFSFGSDTNSGTYRIGSDNIGIAVNGTKIVDIGTAGINVTGSITASSVLWAPDSAQVRFGNAPDYWFEYVPGSTLFRLQSTDVDGGGTDGTIFSVTDGSSALTVSGALILGSSAADAGTVRLANTAAIRWRNAANSANRYFSLNASDQFVLEGTLIPNSDSTYDLGTSSVRWSTGYFDSVNVGAASSFAGAATFSVAATNTMARFRASDLTADQRQFDVRIDASGNLEIRSVTDSGTTVAAALDIAHATGAATFGAGVAVGTNVSLSSGSDYYVGGTTYGMVFDSSFRTLLRASAGVVFITDADNSDTSGSFSWRRDGATASTGTLMMTLSESNSALYPGANDGLALGISGTAWSDLFLASGSVVDFNAGDVTVTHSSNLLTLAGGGFALTGTVGIDVNPGSDADADLLTVGVTGSPRLWWDESENAFRVTTGFQVAGPLTLGSATTSNADGQAFKSASGGFTVRGVAGSSYDFQVVTPGSVSVLRVPTGTDDVEFADDILLGSGAVINFASSDVTLTHSSNQLTVSGGTFEMANSPFSARNSGTAQFSQSALNLIIDEVGTNEISTYGVFAEKQTAGAGTGSADLLVRARTRTNGDYLNVVRVNGNAKQLVFLGGDSGTDAAIQREDWSIVLGTGIDFVPQTNDGVALGTSSLAFSDLFLASGSVINFNAGDVTLTHSSNALTFAGGTLVVGTVDINGGAIDGVTIGGSSAGAGSFTTLSASTSITGTLATAAQTNITSLGTLTNLQVDSVNVNGTTVSSSGNLELSSSGFVYLNGAGGTGVTVCATGDALSFFDGARQAQATVTGSKGGNTALSNLLAALASYGLIVDSTT